jgi:hypothetical protein
VSALVYSNPVFTPKLYFENENAGGLATWYTAACGSLEGTILTGVRPRPLIWENGASDNNGPESAPLEFVERVRRSYQDLGASATTFEFIRHGGGHATRPDEVLTTAIFRALSEARR